MDFLPRKWPVLACLALAAAAPPLAANCKVFRLSVPDPAELNLTDGDHLLASVATDHGNLEARVTVRNSAASSPRYTIGGRPMRQVQDSQVPQDILRCLQQSPPRGDDRADAMRLQPVPFAPGEVDVVEEPALPGPRVGARGTCDVVTMCGHGVCVATSCCRYGLVGRTVCATFFVPV